MNEKRFEVKHPQTTTRIIINTDSIDNAVLRLKELGIHVDPNLLKLSNFPNKTN
jgi:hypothetical protein